MGSWLTHLRWGGDPDVPCPISGLTRRDIHAVQNSWTPVYANHVVTGTEILKSRDDMYVCTKDCHRDTVRGSSMKVHIHSAADCPAYMLFRAHPKYRQLFKMIKDLPEEEYIDNFQFKAHVINLMTSLHLAVRHLHQPEVVISMMEKIGESHNRRMLKEQHFHDLKQVIVTMFIEVLALDEKTLQSWGRTVVFLYKHIFTKLDNKDTQAS